MKVHTQILRALCSFKEVGHGAATGKKESEHQFHNPTSCNNVRSDKIPPLLQ